MQLFDTPESLVRQVSASLAEGDARGEHLLVVCLRDHWTALAAELRRSCDVDRIIVDGRLTVLDAEILLSRFMRHGRPNRALFQRTVGAVVRRLSEDAGGRLRVYGEMVELLARDRNFDGAMLLEVLWNELAARHSFTLLCGYSAAHFAGPDGSAALSAICAQHTHALSTAADPLGQFLVAREHGAHP